jgi:hypothetical protein
MDAKVSEDGLSHGRSGKSLAYKALLYFMKHWVLAGRNPKLTENPHIYGSIDEHTDIVLVDDGNQYLKFEFFFEVLTGDMNVNPKNNKEFIVPFSKAPKFVITSNYTLRNLDASTEGRLLYSVFGDYYHVNRDNEYRQSRSVKDDLGKNLYFDFTDDEWNYCINTLAYCSAFYMNHEKIEPPMSNVARRNMLTQMTDVLKDWADVYFSTEAGHLDQFVRRDLAFENFKTTTGQKNWTPQRYLTSLKYWCNYYGYELNPKEYQNAKGAKSEKGRIMKKVKIVSYDRAGQPNGESEETKEHIYIKTRHSVPEAINVIPDTTF